MKQLISLEPQQISNKICKILISLASLYFLTSCTSLELQDVKTEKRKAFKTTPQKIFIYSYDSVWKAALTVLKYSITDQNQETGHIETDYIKATEGAWIRPDSSKPLSSGIRYKIAMSFVKVKSESGRNGVKVTIEKKIEKLKDFFSDPEIVETDGLEEKAIFYRIERELIIEEAISKAPASN